MTKPISSRWTGKSLLFGFPMSLYLEINDLRKENIDLTRDEVKKYLNDKYKGTFTSEVFDTVLNFVYRDQHQEESPTDFKP